MNALVMKLMTRHKDAMWEQIVRRRCLSACVGIFLLIAGGGVAPRAKADAPPNVVLILADDLGFSDLGCYGGEIDTPNVDRLAENGIRFTQFYNTARCWPTRAALMTGYYAQQVRRDSLEGVPSGSRGKRPKWARLLPEMIRVAGYRSYHSGKWHLDGLPMENGFDRSYNLQDQGRFFSPQRHTRDDRKLPPVERESGYYATSAIADHAIECLQEHARDYDEKPFFHFVAFTSPHFPLHALPEDIARNRARYLDGWDAVRATRWAQVQSLGIVRGDLSAVEREVGPPYDFPEHLAQLGPGEINRPVPWDQLTSVQQAFQAEKMAIHAAMVDRMDRDIGRIVAQLETMGAMENTLILFLSDNGASAEIMVRNDGHDPNAEMGSAATHLCLGPGWSNAANTPFRRHKTWVHEGGIATPMVAHWPRGIAARGALRNDVAHVIDFVPTVLELAGAGDVSEVDGTPVPESPGTSLLPALTGDGQVEHESLWWSHEGNRALRMGDWKLVKAKADERWELFDLSSDRTETRDLATSQPDRAEAMAEKWFAMRDAFLEIATQDLADPPATDSD